MKEQRRSTLTSFSKAPATSSYGRARGRGRGRGGRTNNINPFYNDSNITNSNEQMKRRNLSMLQAKVMDNKLKDLIPFGVSYHHAG